jgi:hypothetical protein
MLSGITQKKTLTPPTCGAPRLTALVHSALTRRRLYAAASARPPVKSGFLGVAGLSELPQENGPTSAFHSCIPTGVHGPTCIFGPT